MPIHVSGVGAVTPVGLNAAASCAALRAAIARLAEVPVYGVDGELFAKEPVVGGRVPIEWFDGEPEEELWPGHKRMGLPLPPARYERIDPDSGRLVELALPAVSEAWRQAGIEQTDQARIGLYLGLECDEDPAPVVEALISSLGIRPATVVPVAQGRASGLLALEAALADLTSNRISAALLGGVDSLLRVPTLRRLEEAGLLRSASVPEGVLPGEAAAFTVLETATSIAARGATPLCLVRATCSTRERTIGTGEPNQAAGLTQALHQIKAEGGVLEDPPLIVCDLNGERYRAQEWAIASLRTLGSIHGDIDVWHPADCTGDTGAASGILNIVWATTAMQRGYAAWERVLIWGASDGQERAAAMLSPSAAGV